MQSQTSAAEEAVQLHCSTAAAAKLHKWFRSQPRFPKLVRESVKTRVNQGDEYFNERRREKE